ncbi:MAG: NUDIX hydrolase [Firmicutes bacterium]|jgi:8-oxo-dGTP diphosphatase|uniref:DNA mismatch repair protein MutT n=1 Tax=Sulfobacillus benefaciens TaxID=453960 RepID=A0A2T2X9E0_9FIRM|nr:NUDIX hydrolase [Bacillota bacterium]MCL5013102.1 NUDIX hydrolase [Bacillota bacterium]PSR31105.1 MAG: DNA mismatch repair protein MutT [Sulfobacillus benefaciens]
MMDDSGEAQKQRGRIFTDIPKHTVAAAAYITNIKGQVLLVQTYHRHDTWELPGGQVEEGETLEEAVIREVEEESGIEVNVQGVSGVYQNRQTGVVVVIFIGEMTGGRLRTSTETKAARFVDPSPQTFEQLVTRPQFLARTLDAYSGASVPFRAAWPSEAANHSF